MNLEQDIDQVNRTTDAHEICFDIVNLSESTMLFGDFSPERAFARKNGDVTKILNFPPLEIKIPPGFMCTIPDEHYRGKTADGKTVTKIYKFFGTGRPTRRTKRRFSRRTLITTVIAPNWIAVPVNDTALAAVEAVRAGIKV